MTTIREPFRITPAVMNYEWGIRGASSLVAKLINRTEDIPFAELWYGTHPKGQSTLADSPGTSLGEWCKNNQVAEPSFLLKVLSVAAPLSIQLHPTKDFAEVLHQQNPSEYPDQNHKPEIFLPLTPVTLLQGMRSRSEIEQLVNSHPEISPIAKLNDNYLRAFLTAPAELIRSCAEKLVTRLSCGDKLSEEDRWVLRFQELYPNGDPGVFSPYFLNLLTVPPGEASFTSPGIPHAYLAGDMVECMANSDNVIRAGLTPKYRDIPNFIAGFVPANARLIGKVSPEIHPDFHRFTTSAEEFVLDRISATAQHTVPEVPSLQILLSISGTGELRTQKQVLEVSAGDAFFISPGASGYTLALREGTAFKVFCPHSRLL